MLLEETVIAHPYLTGFFAIGFLVFFVIAIKRFIADDFGPSGYDYSRLQKEPGRLD